MAGPIAGLVECFLTTGFASGTTQSFFVSCFNFLYQSRDLLGLSLVAYHTGAKGTGMANARGMGYFDSADPCGTNAFACFRFNSASKPFDLLIQWTDAGTAFGTAPGSPALMNGGAGGNAFGWAVGQRLDGGPAWNGSSGSNGMDTKGTPVWHPGTSSAAYYPRSNDSIRAGTHGASKQNCLGVSVTSNNAYRAHFFADYDTFAYALDISADNSYTVQYITAYTPLSGVNPDLSYCSFGSTVAVTSPATVYGDVAGSLGGGISYPNLALSGTCACTTDRYTTIFPAVLTQPNRAYATPQWNEMPIAVAIYETPSQMGMVGQINSFIKEVFNIATHDTNATGTRCVFGDTTVATTKVTLPFHSGTTPGTGLTKGGVYFSL